MGVMSKLLESHQARAITLPARENRSAAPSACSSQPQAIPAPTWPSHWPAPAPCPTCLSPGFWVDVYGGGPHCRGCNPPSSPTLVKMPAWVIGTPDTYRWVRDPKAHGNHPNSHRVADSIDGDEWVTWLLPSGDTATALRERIDQTRTGSPAIMPTGLGGTGKLIEVRRYSPALACGPVGDLTLDEWFDRLPEFPTAGIAARAAAKPAA